MPIHWIYMIFQYTFYRQFEWFASGKECWGEEGGGFVKIVKE